MPKNRNRGAQGVRADPNKASKQGFEVHRWAAQSEGRQ